MLLNYKLLKLVAPVRGLGFLLLHHPATVVAIITIRDLDKAGGISIGKLHELRFQHPCTHTGPWLTAPTPPHLFALAIQNNQLKCL